MTSLEERIAEINEIEQWYAMGWIDEEDYKLRKLEILMPRMAEIIRAEKREAARINAEYGYMGVCYE